MPLTDFQRELCTSSRWDFSDLRAMYVNCTLKPAPELSNTEGLMRISIEIMKLNGVAVDSARARLRARTRSVAGHAGARRRA